MDSAHNIAYCTRLPEEVWLKCFAGADPSDLSSMVAVCRYFKGLCQPLLFQNMQLTALKGPSAIQHAGRSTTRLEDLAASSRVSSVRSWMFTLRVPGGRRTPYVDVAKTYSDTISIFRTTLGAYHNLRSLSLCGLTIDAPLRHTIASLEMLQEVTLSDSIVLARTGALLAVREFSLSVSRLSGNLAIEENEPLHLVSPATLHTLILDGSREASTFLSALIQHGTFSNLQYLTCQLSDLVIGPLLQFLEHCPDLAQIEINPYSALSKPLPDRLSPSAISRLRSFKGPHSIAGFFTSGRPVSTVELGGSQTMQGVLGRSIESLSRASPALRSLSIMVPVASAQDITAMVAAQFSQLEELCLTGLAEDPDRTRDHPYVAMKSMLDGIYEVHDLTKPPFLV